MQHRPLSVAVLVFVCVVTLIAPGGASASPAVVALAAAGASEIQDVYVRMPQAPAPTTQPLQVVIALHGMGGNGPDFAAPLVAQADENGWVLVAPTISYGDWTDPVQITHEDPALISWLSEYVDHLGERTGAAVQPRVLLFGHSRGAQLALRFTELHPEQVTAVAAVSAGTYTLPSDSADFPYGVADVARDDGGLQFNPQQFLGVPVWIGVGALDTNPADVPHAWDAYIGKNRVERARTFARTLQQLGGDASLTVFPGADHGLTQQMCTQALDDLAAEEAAHSPG